VTGSVIVEKVKLFYGEMEITVRSTFSGGWLWSDKELCVRN